MRVSLSTRMIEVAKLLGREREPYRKFAASLIRTCLHTGWTRLKPRRLGHFKTSQLSTSKTPIFTLLAIVPRSLRLLVRLRRGCEGLTGRPTNSTARADPSYFVIRF